MSNAMIDRLLAEKTDREAFVRQLLDSAESEERALTDSEVANIEAAKERLAAITAQVAPLVEWEEQRTAAAEFEGRVSKQTKKAVAVRQSDTMPLDGRSLGQAFVESPEFRESGGGAMQRRFHADTTLWELDRMERAATVLNEGAAPGNAFLPVKEKFYSANPLYPFRLWDLVNHVMVRSASVDVVTYGTYEGGVAAAEVAELAEKPAEELKSAIQSVNLPTVAGYVEVSRQLLQDGGSAVRNWIDGELRRSIMYHFEKEISTILAGAAATTGAAGVPGMGVIRQAQAVLQSKGYNPTALVANPADLASLDQEIFGQGFMVPNQQNAYWGLTPIAAPTQPAGKMVVADLDRAITVYQRTGLEVYTSDSGIVSTPGSSVISKDRFIHNIFVILAELRGKSVLTHADAATLVTVTPKP